MRDRSRLHDTLHVRFDRVQVVWLGMGVVVCLALTFALGFLVGRRAERLEHAGAGEPGAPADPIARLDAAKEAHEELTFYARLTEPTPPPVRRPRPVERAEPPAPAPPPEPVRQQPPRPAPVEPEAPPAPVPQAAPEPVGADRDDPVRSALDAGPAGPGDYTIQVSAFRSLGEAEAFSAGLERKGFRPFVVTAHLDGRGTWYRVRLGRFSDERTANAAKARLAQAAIPAWVLRTE